MKKSVVIVLLLGVVGVVGSLPYWFGTQAEKIYTDQIAYLRAENQIQVTYNEFERGFLRSHAATRLHNPDVPYSVDAEHVIEHGPFPVTKLWHYLSGLNPVQALINSNVQVVFGSQPPVSGSARTVVDINGVATTHFSVPARQTSLAENYDIAWDEISGRVRLGAEWGAWRGSARAAQTRLSRGAMTLTMGPTVLQFDTSVGHNQLLVGSSSFSTEVVTLKTDGAAPGAITIRGLTLESLSEELGARMDYQLKGRSEEFDNDLLQTGAATWDVSLRRLDSAAIMKIGGSIRSGRVPPVNELTDLVIKHNAVVSANARVATESGAVVMKADLGFAPDVELTQPLLAFLALRGSVKAEAPARVVELVAADMIKRDLVQLQEQNGVPALSDDQLRRVIQTAVPQRIQSWIDSGYVVRQNDVYAITAALENGSLSLNGKPTDVMSMLR